MGAVNGFKVAQMVPNCTTHHITKLSLHTTAIQVQSNRCTKYFFSVLNIYIYIYIYRERERERETFEHNFKESCSLAYINLHSDYGWYFL